MKDPFRWRLIKAEIAKLILMVAWMNGRWSIELRNYLAIRLCFEKIPMTRRFVELQFVRHAGLNASEWFSKRKGVFKGPHPWHAPLSQTRRTWTKHGCSPGNYCQRSLNAQECFRWIVGNIVCGSFGSGFVFFCTLCVKREFTSTRIQLWLQFEKLSAVSEVFDAISSDYFLYTVYTVLLWSLISLHLKVNFCNLLEDNGFGLLNGKTAWIFTLWPSGFYRATYLNVSAYSFMVQTRKTDSCKVRKGKY